MSATSTRTARLSDLLAGAPGAVIHGDPETVITGIEYDSRLIRAGNLFAALRGADSDGHDFAHQATARGAAAMLVEEAVSTAVPLVIVENSRRSLAGIAAEFYGQPSRQLGVIGVTGTDGKTTTSYLIDAILRTSGCATGMIGTVAVRIANDIDAHSNRQTTPESSEIQRLLRRMVDAGVEWATLEATSHGLDLFRMDHTEFRIAAVTNVTHEHLEHHKTLQAYHRAKAILFERTTAARGTSVVNLDDIGAAGMLRYTVGADTIRYSMDGHLDANLLAADVALTPDGSTFQLIWGNDAVTVSLPLIGRFNIANALCAAGVALAAGLSLPEISDGLRHIPAVPGRMARVDMGQPFSVIVDYAHTPAALETALRLLRSLHPTGRLICVSGSAGDRDATKRPLQGAVSARLADVSIITSEDPRNEDPNAIIEEITQGAIQAGAVQGIDMYRVTDRAEAIQLALAMAGAGDCVLLAGKGHEQSIIWAGTQRAWDEGSVARDALRGLGFHGGAEA